MENPNTAAEFFQMIMDRVIQETVPMRKAVAHRYSRKYPTWFTLQIIASIKAKERARRKLKRSSTLVNALRFQTLRKFVKNQIRRAEKIYKASLEHELIMELSKFWQYIKGKRRGTGNARTKVYKDEEINDPQAIADAFQRHFSSVYTQTQDRRNIQEAVWKDMYSSAPQSVRLCTI